MSWSFFGKSTNKSNKQRSRKSRRGEGLGARRLHRLEQLEQRNLLAVLTVNANTDNTTSDSMLSLREALAIVKFGSISGTIPDLGHALTTGATSETAQINTSTPLGINDTIQFLSASFPSGTNMPLLLGELPIDKSVTIIGPGLGNLILDGQTTSRIFDVSAGDVAIQGVTMTRGAALPSGIGGAILSSSLGTLTIADSKITGSKAANGGAIYVTGDLKLTNVQVGLNASTPVATDQNQATTGSGGGIFSIGSSVVLKNSVISGNAAHRNGGGIYATLATVSLQNSIVGGLTGSNPLLANSAGTAAAAADGGGIDANSVSLLTSTVSGNSAARHGGGIEAGIVVLQNSTVSGNTAGAFTSVTGGYGGGIHATSVTVRNSTVALNHAYGVIGAPPAAFAGSGGGIYASLVMLQNATVAGNTADAALGNGGGVFAAAKLIIQNSIVIGNTDNGGGPTFPDINNPAMTSVRYSLIGNLGSIPAGASGTQFFPSPTTPNPTTRNFIGGGGGATINTPTVLDTVGPVVNLKNNNGAYPTTTETIALAAASIAIDKGNNAFVVNETLGDQRGQPFARISPLGPPAAHIVDMGAFEIQNPPLPPVPTTVTITNPPAATVGLPFTFNAGSFFPGTNLTFAAANITSGLVSPPGALPDWLGFNQSTGVFTGTPTALDVGAITVKVTSTDQIGGVSTGQFTLTVAAAPVVTPPAVTTLPYTQNFDTVVPPALPISILVKVPAFATVAAPTGFPPTGNVNVLQATRPTVGARPVAVVDLAPAAAAAVTNVNVDVSTGGGNGTTLWNNAVVVFDYQSPTNYKFAGVFQIIHKLIIGQVVNGRVSYLAQKNFNAPADTRIPLQVAINRASGQVVLSSGGTSVTRTFAALGTGTVGVGTINANAKFDNLAIT